MSHKKKKSGKQKLVGQKADLQFNYPIKDYLQLDNSARINQPSTLGTNWKWRLKEGQFSKELQKEMLTLATRFGRRNWTPDPEKEK